MIRTKLASVAVAAAVAVLAGCGAGSENDYRTASQKAANEFRQSVAQASKKIPNGSSLKERVAGIAAYKTSVDRLADKLDGLDPPDSVVKLHDQAVADLHALSADLGRFEVAAKSNDPTAAKPVAARLAQDQAKLRRVLDEIDRKLSG